MSFVVSENHQMIAVDIKLEGKEGHISSNCTTRSYVYKDYTYGFIKINLRRFVKYEDTLSDQGSS